MAAIRAYGSVESFRGRANPIESAGEAYFKNRPNDALRQAINDLLRLSTTKFGARRSEIAHGIVNPYFKIENGQSVQKGLVLYPAYYATRKRKLPESGPLIGLEFSKRGRPPPAGQLDHSLNLPQTSIKSGQSISANEIEWH